MDETKDETKKTVAVIGASNGAVQSGMLFRGIAPFIVVRAPDGPGLAVDGWVARHTRTSSSFDLAV